MSAYGRLHICVTVCFSHIYLSAQMVHAAESAEGQNVQLGP